MVNEKEVKNENKKQQKDKEKKENIPSLLSLSLPSPSTLLAFPLLSVIGYEGGTRGGLSVALAEHHYPTTATPPITLMLVIISLCAPFPFLVLLREEENRR